MRFSEMNKRQLKDARDELQKRLYPTLGTTRVSELSDNSVFLDGGYLPARFVADNTGGTLYVWGRGSRHSGAEMSVHELQKAELIIRQFYIECIQV
ncbi:hypothetical protein [Halobacillus ihumii]|uniref:hypothetical protein n=1 Tax=Halobacillus ihumii TaxID=2686092 RepID=UPI0013D25EB4|nr:hypothetical protein [Halobacillus ihumii]